MIKIDTSKPLCEIVAGGTTEEIAKELTMAIFAIATGMKEHEGKNGLFSAIYLLTSVSAALSDSEMIAAMLFGSAEDNGIVSTTQEDDETEEDARKRGLAKAMELYFKTHAITVDENYNVIDGDEKGDEDE